ncbi:MAG: RidA family protein [Pseudomonadota bacterium]
MPKKTTDPKRQLITLSEGEKTYAMSRALVQGDWCFVSGTVGYDYTTGDMPDDPAQQAMNAFANIQAALKGGGFELGHTVRVQYTLSSRDHVDAVLPVIRQHYGNILPAATMVIADLVAERMKVEIEVTAFKG